MWHSGDNPSPFYRMVLRWLQEIAIWLELAENF
jgi:hypothetical protein